MKLRIMKRIACGTGVLVAVLVAAAILFTVFPNMAGRCYGECSILAGRPVLFISLDRLSEDQQRLLTALREKFDITFILTSAPTDGSWRFYFHVGCCQATDKWTQTKFGKNLGQIVDEIMEEGGIR